MKLGNSGANNKGKKYIKIKPGDKATPENLVKAEEFKVWFGKLYNRLRKELIAKDTYDEDILNDTFLRIYDKIQFGGLVILNYKAYFHRAFFTNFMQQQIQNAQGITTPIDGFDKVDEQCNEEEIAINLIRLESDIFDFVYYKYPVHEFEIFKMYISLKPVITYAELSTITGISQPRISEIISKIRRDICAQNQFVIRRKAFFRFAG